jgi:pSer/pThr/pTyr-binding forkhead associated (FHA) protein
MSITKKFGRATDNDIIIDNASISKYHFQITLQSNGTYQLTDLDSTNGTKINGIVVKGTISIHKGDDLLAGGVEVIWENYFLEAEKKLTQKPIEKKLAVSEKSKHPKSISRISPFLLISFAFVVIVGYFMLKGNGISSENKRDTLGKFIIPDSVKYDFECYKDESDKPVAGVFDLFNDFRKEFNKEIYDKVTVEDEMEYGSKMLEDILKKEKKWQNETAEKRCVDILNRLTKEIKLLKKPRGFKFKLTMIDAKEINAYTCGGQIIFTRGMYEFCKSDDELACVISHEIAHNERGHLTKSIAELNTYGPFKVLQQLLAPRFDQFDEGESDMWGMDLAIRAGFDACANIELWKRMKEKFNEGEYSTLENLFRSHPYSELRSKCSAHHLKLNYKTNCD